MEIRVKEALIGMVMNHLKRTALAEVQGNRDSFIVVAKKLTNMSKNRVFTILVKLVTFLSTW